MTGAVSTDDGDRILAGSERTVVGVWRDGAAYEVEVAPPSGVLSGRSVGLPTQVCLESRNAPNVATPDFLGREDHAVGP